MAPSASPRGAPPRCHSSLLGREAELAQARSLLIDEAVPLLTLTGPGGVGKTRLALAILDEIAGHFADGAVWIDLALLSDGALVAASVAATLEVAPIAEWSEMEAVISHLRRSQLLLVFDNCEHLLNAAAGLISALVARCPAVQILATSRAPLHIRGEQLLPLPALGLPMLATLDLESAHAAPAIALFLQRARAVDPQFSLTGANVGAVAELCHRMDGLPLAIELAAAQVAVLPPAAMVALMHQNVSVLASGPHDAPARHQNMGDAIAWSYRLLAPADQRFLRAMSVFIGGWTLDAAASVSGLSSTEALSRLVTVVRQSLVVRQPDDGSGNPRFTMLETIREFALEQLREMEEEAEIRRRHAAYFRELPDRLDAIMLAYLLEFRQVMDRLSAEYPNLRAALRWHQSAADASSVLQIAGPLDYFWRISGFLADGRMWLEWGLHQENSLAEARRIGQLGLAGVLYAQSEAERALALCQESIHAFEAAGDTFRTAFACHLSAHIALVLGDPDLAGAAIEAAWHRFSSLADCPGQQNVLHHLEMLRGWAAFLRGDTEGAAGTMHTIATRQRSAARVMGVPQPHLSWTLLNWGYVTRAQGQFDEARVLYQEALHHGWQHQDYRCCARALAGIAGILVASGKWQIAARLYGAVEAFCQRTHLGFHAVWVLELSFGIPASWWQTGRPVGAESQLIRAVVLARGSDRMPPLPSRQAVTEAWANGRALSFEEAMALAKANDPARQSQEDGRASTAHLPPVPGAVIEPLTRRERDVLELLCQHLSDAEIADQLYIGTRTVEFHVANILGKLGAANRRDAAAIAARLSAV